MKAADSMRQGYLSRISLPAKVEEIDGFDSTYQRPAHAVVDSPNRHLSVVPSVLYGLSLSSGRITSRSVKQRQLSLARFRKADGVIFALLPAITTKSIHP